MSARSTETGEVVALDPRGYGFIRAGRDRVFFGAWSLQDVSFDRLRKGQQVRFEPAPSCTGPRAARVWTESSDASA